MHMGSSDGRILQSKVFATRRTIFEAKDGAVSFSSSFFLYNRARTLPKRPRALPLSWINHPEEDIGLCRIDRNCDLIISRRSWVIKPRVAD